MNITVPACSGFYNFDLVLFLVHENFIYFLQLLVHHTVTMMMRMMMGHLHVKSITHDPAPEKKATWVTSNTHCSCLNQIKTSKHNLTRFSKPCCPILDLKSLACLPTEKKGTQTPKIIAIKHPKTQMTREPQRQQNAFNDRDKEFSNKQIFQPPLDDNTWDWVVKRPARESNDRSWLMLATESYACTTKQRQRRRG